jgi:hypothetical protein
MKIGKEIGQLFRIHIAQLIFYSRKGGNKEEKEIFILLFE